MSIPGNANPLLLASAAAAGAVEDNRSLRFNSDDSSSLTKTFSSAGNRKTWTWSAWVKRSGLGDYNFLFQAQTSGTRKAAISFWNSDIIKFKSDSSDGEHTVDTDAVFRDPSAWYHIVLRFDTTQSTAANRIRIYVNGVEQTYSTAQYPSQNSDHEISNSSQHFLGSQSGAPENGLDGGMADVYFIDGASLDPTSFGAYDSNGVWQKADYSGTFGTNGFHLLDFANESTIGHDSSGNNNDFTANNLSTTAGSGNDVLFDYPANGDTDNDSGAGGQVNGNYAVMNPHDSQSSLTLSNGNLDVSNTANSLRNSRATIPYPATGKWYYEYTPGGSANMAIGIADSLTSLSAENSGTFVTYHQDGAKNVNGTKTASAFASYTAGDVIGVLYDSDANSLTFYKNNSSQGSVTPTSGKTYFPFIITYNTTGSFNFGARAFEHSQSTAKTLCTTNLPTPTIADGSDHFDTVLYTGNGSSGRNITGYDFNPDFVWVKLRSDSAYNAVAVDSVRTAGRYLVPNARNAESVFGYISAFVTGGFTVSGHTEINGSSRTYVAWGWHAASSTSSNTDGDITSSVRANQTAGFSIITYTGNGTLGATVGHGLNTNVGLYFVKNRTSFTLAGDGDADWVVIGHGLNDIFGGSNKYLRLNKTDSVGNAGQGPGNTSTIELYNDVTNNKSGDNYVAYCFAPVEGYSAITSFVGNGSTDGPFCYLGFRPRFILYKSTGTSDHWNVLDTARSTKNPLGPYLQADNTAAEGNADLVDIYSNGFRPIFGTGNQWNGNGVTYLVYAIAENPFQANGGLAR